MKLEPIRSLLQTPAFQDSLEAELKRLGASE